MVVTLRAKQNLFYLLYYKEKALSCVGWNKFYWAHGYWLHVTSKWWLWMHTNWYVHVYVYGWNIPTKMYSSKGKNGFSRVNNWWYRIWCSLCVCKGGAFIKSKLVSNVGDELYSCRRSCVFSINLRKHNDNPDKLTWSSRNNYASRAYKCVLYSFYDHFD